MTNHTHVPVLLDEVLEHLEIEEGDTVVDATLGLGGHAQAILGRLGKSGKLIGIDQDANALSIARENLKDYGSQFIPAHGNFRDLDRILSDLGIVQVEGCLIDLGVSSLQLDDGSRGFSFKTDAPLDMRMDTSGGITAADILRDSSERELAALFLEYGEEYKADRIAHRIVEMRHHRPIATTFDLVEAVGGKPGKIHPATKVFQALRIAVNEELEVIKEVLPKAVECLAPGGRLAIISFHSLEDRIVKNYFKNLEEQGKILLINKKVIQAKWAEKSRNKRSRSAKLRIVEKI